MVSRELRVQAIGGLKFVPLYLVGQIIKKLSLGTTNTAGTKIGRVDFSSQFSHISL
jgi:hypothetical protein